MWIDLEALQAAVIAARDRDLYMAAKPFLMQWDRQIELLKAQLPDSGIEEQLCEELWRCKPGDAFDNASRRFITDALSVDGTVGCLGALEALLYDLAPRISTARVVHEAMGYSQAPDEELDVQQLLDGAVRRIDIEYGRVLREAVAAIRVRNVAPRNEWNIESIVTPQPNLFASARNYIQEAEKLCDSKMGAALNEVRKATEAMLKEALGRAGVTTNAKGDSIEGFVLGALVTLAKEKIALREITIKGLDLIRLDTNTGSHDQGLAEEEYLTPDTVRGAIARYRLVETQVMKLLT